MTYKKFFFGKLNEMFKVLFVLFLLKFKNVYLKGQIGELFIFGVQH